MEPFPYTGKVTGGGVMHSPTTAKEPRTADPVVHHSHNPPKLANKIKNSNALRSAIKHSQSSTMSDALGSFLNQLIECSGRPGSHISIISDNARRTQDPDLPSNARKRRAPRRSASSPLNHMSSRWEPALSIGSMHSSSNPQPRILAERKSRWESESASIAHIKLTRPKRDSSSAAGDGFLSPVHDTGKLQKRNSSNKNLKKEMTTSDLPKSLRSLPY